MSSDFQCRFPILTRQCGSEFLPVLNFRPYKFWLNEDVLMGGKKELTTVRGEVRV